MALSPEVIRKIFRDVFDRNMADGAEVNFLNYADADALRAALLRTPEYQARNETQAIERCFGTYDQEPAEIVLSDQFRARDRSRKNRIGWPLSQVFVSHKAKVIYCPIGKVACTFLKQQMVRISDVAHRDLILGSVHQLTDSIATGLQLSDYSETQARSLCEDPDYTKIAVLRDPHERLLSAYMEKFVIARKNEGNLYHTAPVVKAVHSRAGLTEPDFDLGISFRDFVDYVVTETPNRLDPHWRPQSLYLAVIDYDRIFAFENIDKVVDFLEERSGVSLPRQAANVTGSGKGLLHAGAADLQPRDLDALPKLNRASFYDSELAKSVSAYFQADIALRNHLFIKDNK